MEKKPLIQIDTGTVEVWHESPSIIAVYKPPGMPVHPESVDEKGTLLNLLFQHNRWLSEMETSVAAGVLHLFSEHDHGLMLFIKDDKYQEALEKEYKAGNISFSYLVKYAGNDSGGKVSLLDLEATTGNTEELRKVHFPDLNPKNTEFYCYQIELTLPHSGQKHTIRLRNKSRDLPKISLYHAPPCSSCRQARELISRNGLIYEDYNVMEEGVVEKMMEINGGIKAIPTVVVDDQVLVGFDRIQLKKALGVE